MKLWKISPKISVGPSRIFQLQFVAADKVWWKSEEIELDGNWKFFNVSIWLIFFKKDVYFEFGGFELDGNWKFFKVSTFFNLFICVWS